MKRVKAFFLALILFAATVLICHVYSSKQSVLNSEALGTLASEEKGKLRTALVQNIDKNGYVVFGSSEFLHGTDTNYHPAQVFLNSDFHPMLIGAGYYQSLSHAVTLASIEEGMQVRKAALIVSPQWFRKTGVVDQAYASRFTETHYAAAMANEKLSDEVKQYISDRTQLLLNVDTKTQERVKMYDNVLWKKDADALEVLKETVWTAFLNEKEQFETMLLGKSAEMQEALETAENAEDAECIPDWAELMQQAEAEGDEKNQNQFYIDGDAYKRLLPHLPQKEGMNSDAEKGYQTGPEFDDLRCFLEVCQELEIEPMLVLIPVNGYYYDFTGFPKDARQKYYEKIRNIAEEYDAKVADFADQEYTKYFFEDRVHLGMKGWTAVNESLYEFYKET